MINLKIDPEFQSQIPPLTDDEFKQLEENILKEGKLISPLIVWNNTLVDGHNRYAILQKHPEIYFSTMPLRFESREEVLAWICKNQLGRRNLTPEQKKFLIGKQYSVEHRKPGGNGNNQHTAAAKKTVPEELCQFDTIPPTASEASVRKQIAERNNVSESYVARSEKFMRGVEIMEQMVPGMQEKILSGQFKVRDADMHRLAKADFPNRKQIVHEILHPEDRPAPQSSYSHYSEINYSALEVAVRRIQQDFDFLMRYLPKLPDDSYAKTETLKILKQHKAYMAQFEDIFSELYNVPVKIKKDYFKIKVLELLLYLDALELSGHTEERPYFYKSQVEKIKAIQSLLTQDLTKNYTLEELSAKFDIALTPMKNCFKSVYGSPIFTYMRNYRMNYAAALLKSDKSLKVADVAGLVGYDSPSKFTAAFHQTMGKTPLEYRKSII